MRPEAELVHEFQMGALEGAILAIGVLIVILGLVAHHLWQRWRAR